MKASLLILGVLHRGDFHPYEIKRRLKNAMVECYTDVKVGPLYYAVQQLEKDGLITARNREPSARGGMRTVYAITQKGRRAFQGLLLEQFEAEGSVASTLYGAMLFLHLCDLPRVAELLRKKIARQDELIAELETLRRQYVPLLSTGGRRLFDHIDMQRRQDSKWLKALLADVEAGRVSDVADPKALSKDNEAALRAMQAAPKNKRAARKKRKTR